MDRNWVEAPRFSSAQDTMMLRPDLTVTLGVRHEFNNGWNSRTGSAGNFVFDSHGVLLTQPAVGKSVYSENNATKLIGPRVGVAWSPFGGSKTAIHAGYGMYYEQLDNMGNCCDAIPIGSSNLKVTVAPSAFPILLAAGQTLPGSAQF